MQMIVGSWVESTPGWLLPTLGFGLGCVLLTWVLTRGALAKAALHEVLRRPALLVPAAMTTVALVALRLAAGGPTLHENPFGLEFARSLGAGRPANWLALGIVAGGLAGQVGLLEATFGGRRADGYAMVAGIRRHFLAIALAKVAVAAGAFALSAWLPRREPLLVAYMVPSLFLAPIAGTTAAHPGRPLRALKDALALAYRNVFRVGGPLIAQTLLLLGIALLLTRLARIPVDPELLTFSSSTVSYNHFPFALLRADGWPVTLATLTSAFGSTVFVTAHWLGVRSGYRPPRPQPPADA